MNGNDTTKYVLGILVTIALALSSWSLKANVDMLGEMKVLKLQVSQLAEDTEADARQDDAIQKHWCLHGWARDEINTLRSDSGKPLAHWPDF